MIDRISIDIFSACGETQLVITIITQAAKVNRKASIMDPSHIIHLQATHRDDKLIIHSHVTLTTSRDVVMGGSDLVKLPIHYVYVYHKQGSALYQ